MLSLLRIIAVGVAALSAAALLAVGAQAGKPPNSDAIYNGNGFPSGPFEHLVILGKKDHFSCPPPKFLVVADGNADGDLGQTVETCDAADQCDPVFGNVVFIPRDQGADPISIVMESGAKGPKSKQDATTLEVTDWCTESFPDDGSSAPPYGDGARVRIPKDPEGYAMYARVRGKPGDDETEHAFYTTTQLDLVEDEQGNDLLLLLGFLTSDGTFAADGTLLRRTDDAKKGKGTRQSVNITDLLLWTGDVCYVQDNTDFFCLDEFGTNLCDSTELCCVDADFDLVYERCDSLLDVGADPDLDGLLECPLTDLDGDPYTPVTAECIHYEDQWVFNIADFVDVLFDVTSDAYNVEIRFYHLPLQ
jgi:hypothetical protein